ncbi:hypothetical protein SUGI_1063770 [Cryptomeria japonica]|uniref:subtilisin-like protease SBT1.6 n=1 Tax=Cryptomeria japonica TaxID=3369 RepID=UPI002414CC25|nr:subtilisin-like protease SBT1.6 [Cryptomeria japonica]GLJ50008.1 hypothetical protein SUGI_1063770 [Cryptomeria japonica]
MDVSWSLVRPLLDCLTFSFFCQYAASVDYASNYVIFMDKSAVPSEFSTHEQWYKSMISSVKDLSANPSSHIDDFYHYTYNTVMNGFSATLTQSELDMLEEMPGHLASLPDVVGHLHTTHSTEFLGLTPIAGLLPASRFGQDIIVALMDTGIWPESESFNDHGMEPVPAKWKGTCENGTAFHPSLCNRKLIGARSFKKGAVVMYGPINSTDDYDSARDFSGHGSHTSSTVGGNYVSNVSFYGYAPGTARGVAPAARVAMYKVSWTIGSASSDVLAGMESAIIDGADVLSLSLGFDSTTPYFIDFVALGAFAAIKKGLLVVCSAGNDGPSRQSIYNGAPWILTVGASTLDRAYQATLKLGDGSIVSGSSFYYSNTINDKLKISNTSLSYDIQDSACNENLVPEKVKGTVVLCMNDSFDIVEAAKAVGAVAVLIVTNRPYHVPIYPYSYFPFVVLNAHDGLALAKYYSSVADPVVEVDFGMTVLSIMPAPLMAEFSSRGPSIHSPNILKPDVIAPGVSILAAWIPTSPRENYGIDSGTSMSCPHVAGVSALLKAVHSEWSPAAIRSALMTTSYTLDNANNTITDVYDGKLTTPLDFGAGHIDPNKAMDPGLIYDINVEDYINYLCILNYTTKQIQLITGMFVSCSSGLDLGSDSLNYPSFIAVFNKNATSPFSSTFKRTLTNVVDGTSYYKAVVEVPKGLKVAVNPSNLHFTEKFQKQNFALTMEAETGMDVVYGFLTWIDNMGHAVKSPVVALFE